jgi:hypothetical protein
MIWGMENKDVRSRAGSTRRAFLSASAVTAVAAPLLSGTALAETDPALSRQAPDPGLRAMLREIDPDRIKATILKLVSFGTRHTGNVTSVTLNISKDNVQFGLRAIDTAGHRSPAAFPQVVN